MPTNTLTRLNVKSRGALMLLISGMFVAPSVYGVDTTWDGSESNDWLNADNWDTGFLPTGADNTFIQSGSVSLSGDGVTRFLRMGTTGTGTSSFTLESGTLVSGGAGGAVLATSDGVTVSFTQNGGTFDVNNDLYMGGIGSGGGGTATYTLNAGTLDLSSTGRSLRMGESTGASTTTSFFQNGGTVIIDSTLHLGTERYGGGSANVNDVTYEVSGGSLTTTDLTMGLATTGGNGTIDAKFNVKGSAATIQVNGSMLMNQNSNNSSTLSYTLDNGGVTTVNVNGAGTATLAGTLEAGLKGGAVLTASSSFNLIEANTTSITNGFTTTPDAALWDVSVADIGGGRDALQLAFAAAANQGSIALGGNTAFTATSKGFAEFTGLGVGTTLDIYLDFDAGTGMTVGEYITYLTSNGIVASVTSDGVYDVIISAEVDAATSYFAWDLTEFNADATLSGLSISTIPEPSTTASLIGVLAISLAFIRRRK